MKDLEKIEKTIGIKFRNKKLLLNALTHTSYAHEHDIEYAECNERLEFIGDAILEMAVRIFLYEKFSDQSEDILTDKKKSLTNQQFLAQLARIVGIDKFLLLGRGELLNEGKNKDSILADTLEAIIGAIYLDQGFKAASKFFFCLVPETLILDPQFDDPKSQLNYWATKNHLTVSYRIIKEEGEPHKKVFFVETLIEKKVIGQGKGKSKKRAEQEAARKALKKLIDEI